MSIVSFKNYINCLIVVLILFSSCSNSGRNELSIYKELDKSLNYSNKAIAGSSEILYKSIEEKLVDPKSREYAKFWQPKAQTIRTFSDDLVNYIDSLKGVLKETANVKLVDGKEVYEIDNRDAANTLFVSKGNGKELYRKLAGYKMNVLNIDPEIDNQFSKLIDVGSVADDSMINEEKFSKMYFNNVPAVSVLTILTRFQNQVRYTENMVVTFCHSKCASWGGCGYTSGPRIIVSQSSNCVKVGDKIEIFAGIGTFSSSAQPTIMINKQKMITEYGLAKYKFKSPATVGKYTIPVRISYTDQNGIEQVAENNVEYTVVKELQTTP